MENEVERHQRQHAPSAEEHGPQQHQQSLGLCHLVEQRQERVACIVVRVVVEHVLVHVGLRVPRSDAPVNMYVKREATNFSIPSASMPEPEERPQTTGETPRPDGRDEVVRPVKEAVDAAEQEAELPADETDEG